MSASSAVTRRLVTSAHRRRQDRLSRYRSSQRPQASSAVREPKPDVFFQLAQVDEAVFRLRSALAGLGEEPALDRIRELMFRGYLAFDDEAVAAADREGRPCVPALLRSSMTCCGPRM